MKSIYSTIRIALVAIALTACGNNTKTEEWYIAHPEEMKKESAKCRTQSFESMMKNEHCKVVEKAVSKSFNEQQRNAPSTQFKFKG